MRPRTASRATLGLLLTAMGLSAVLPACAPPKRTPSRGVPYAQVFTVPAGYRFKVESGGQTPNTTKAVFIHTLSGKVIAEARSDQSGNPLEVPVLSPEADVNVELRGYVQRPGHRDPAQPAVWELMPVKVSDDRTATTVRFVFEDGYDNDQPPEDWNDLMILVTVLPP